MFLFYEKRRRGILRVSFRYYREPVSSSIHWSGSNSFVSLGFSVAPRYRDAGEFRVDAFARGFAVTGQPTDRSFLVALCSLSNTRLP